MHTKKLKFYTLTFKDNIRRNFSLVDQLQRAALSIMNNIAEGFERLSDKEFAYSLNIAKGSSGEVRSMIYVLNDLNFIDNETFKKFHSQITMISKSLSGFISYLKNSPPKPIQS
jgi:four helix bundle protein